VAVAQHGARLDRRAQLRGLAQLVRLEGEAEARVDLVQAVSREEREQVVGEPPAVVRLGPGVDRAVAKHTVDLGLEPAGGVLVERWHPPRNGRRRWLPLAPHPGLHAGEDVLQLDRRRSLVPSASATAVAVAPLVQRDMLASAARSEAKLVDQGAVTQCLRDDHARSGAAHRFPLSLPVECLRIVEEPIAVRCSAPAARSYASGPNAL
jgi:hypothetical protein